MGKVLFFIENDKNHRFSGAFLGLDGVSFDFLRISRAAAIFDPGPNDFRSLQCDPLGNDSSSSTAHTGLRSAATTLHGLHIREEFRGHCTEFCEPTQISKLSL